MPERFTAQRAHLVRKVPGRSPDPSRYRNLIVSVAERVLLPLVSGEVSNVDADANQALSAAYQEWFAEEGVATGIGHQRFSLARADVRRVLRCIARSADRLP